MAEQLCLDFEEWRKIEDVPYEVSSYGRVRRTIDRYGNPSGKFLKGTVNKDGYLQISICMGARGLRRNACIHSLVCESFHGPCPSSEHEVGHWDGNKHNNHYTNLRWVTSAENGSDQVRLGRSLKGAINPNAKLSEQDIIEIRRMIREGISDDIISHKYKIAPGHVWKIGARWNWSHLA